MNKERLLDLSKNNRNTLGPFDYHCLVAPNTWKVVNSIPLRRMLLKSPEETRNSVLSLRLSTGIIGELDCPSGDADYVPRNNNEVIVGLGNQGIKALLELGGLPCITCHSGEKLARLFPAELKASLKTDLDRARDTDFLIGNYDARRLNWPGIVKLGVVPGRFYTRPGLGSREVSAIAALFENAGLPAPAIGYYDRGREDRFYRYN